MLNLITQPVIKFINLLGYNITKIPNNDLTLDIPELGHKHIKNLKVVINREKLLYNLPKNGFVAELGVDEGEFSNLILTVNKPEKLFLIDLWDSDRYGPSKMKQVESKFDKLINDGKVEIIREISETALEQFNDYYFDWIYIDTTHSYEQTYKELETCRMKVKNGGVIAGHDYCQGNIEKALTYGVVRAVNEFCLQYNWEIVWLTLESHGYHSFALREIR